MTQIKFLKNLKKLGYKHQGFTKNFETMQPRYTFRIDLNQSLEEIENHFSKTTKQRIAKAKKTRYLCRNWYRKRYQRFLSSNDSN